MKTTPSPAATTKSALERLVDWLTKQSEATPKHAGMFAYQDERGVGDGDYGDPHIDTQTPDFVKRDNEGWIPLK